MNKLNLIKNARYLRKEETPEEKILWKLLRDNKLHYKFRRQHPCEQFILDFYCPEKKLCIELDGQIHKYTKEYDITRTSYLEEHGIRVIRFWNNQINKDIQNVIIKIKQELSV